ncbi:regulatory protein RecX [Aestuariivivens sediminicola]|uniref:regulatory protein RecX n=1 Tax=Aestuariivivens sediminicola TaxID=2913560 RepID=UPI001F582F1C|nr:RecX family transcriptional regulator [Aestuariivivens sediminicola]
MPEKKSYTVAEATRRLEHYCAYQERCHKEVREKLRDLHMIPEAIDHIMVHLINHNYLNETRFAKAYVSGKFKMKAWGKRRLGAELLKKDISRSIINEAILSLDDDLYLDTLDRLAKKYVTTSTENNTLKKKKKLIDYLLYRGWEPHLVYDKAKELMD